MKFDKNVRTVIIKSDAQGINSVVIYQVKYQWRCKRNAVFKARWPSKLGRSSLAVNSSLLPLKNWGVPSWFLCGYGAAVGRLRRAHSYFHMGKFAASSKKGCLIISSNLQQFVKFSWQFARSTINPCDWRKTVLNEDTIWWSPIPVLHKLILGQKNFMLVFDFWPFFSIHS